jgi:hypothetical protein
VLKGDKRDAEREVKVPVYSATCSGTGKTYKSTSTAAKWERAAATSLKRAYCSCTDGVSVGN